MSERPYDLSNELGPKSQYDRLAGEALFVSTLLQNDKLHLLSSELAKLIRQIRYDSDSFYKVQAKAEEVRGSIKETLRFSGSLATFYIKPEEYDDKHFLGSTMVNIRVNKIQEKMCYEIDFGRFRNYSGTASNTAMEEKIGQYLDEIINMSGATKSSEYLEGINYSFDTQRYTDKNGDLIKDIVWRRHEDGSIGNTNCYYLYQDKYSLAEIKGLWEEVKQLVPQGRIEEKTVFDKKVTD